MRTNPYGECVLLVLVILIAVSAITLGARIEAKKARERASTPIPHLLPLGLEVAP